MKLLRKKYPRETMVLMFGEGNSLLLHETGGKSVFQSPRRYEVIHSSGELKEPGYFAFNNIPVTDEGRPVFEHLFQNQLKQIDSEVGLIASRLLRPLKSDTFLVITQWTNAHLFSPDEQDTSAYGQIYGQLNQSM